MSQFSQDIDMSVMHLETLHLYTYVCKTSVRHGNTELLRSVHYTKNIWQGINMTSERLLMEFWQLLCFSSCLFYNVRLILLLTANQSFLIHLLQFITNWTWVQPPPLSICGKWTLFVQQHWPYHFYLEHSFFWLCLESHPLIRWG